jgi:hypothetical protein
MRTVLSSLNLNTKTTGAGKSTSGSANINLMPSGGAMNMNQDDPYDHRELNTVVQNYVMAEFVAVPPDFDLHSHLSMREHVGIYAVKNMDLDKAIVFIDSIKNAPVFNSMNNAMIDPNICFFVLQLFQELGLILKTIDNPMRRSMNKDEYIEWAKRWETGRHNYVRGQEVLRISFLIVNVVHLFQEKVYEEAIKAMEEVVAYQQEIDSMNYNLDER